MTPHELANELFLASSEMEHNYMVSDWKLLYESALVLEKQADQLADQQTTINFLEAECAALREQLNELSN